LNERAIFFLFSCWAGSWSWVYPTRIGWRSNSTKGVEMAAFFYTSRARRIHTSIAKLTFFPKRYIGK
jgi:hypothetical protein